MVILFLNVSPSGYFFFSSFLFFLGIFTKVILALPGNFLSRELLWSPGYPSRVWLGHWFQVLREWFLHSISCLGHSALQVFSRLGLDCPGLHIRATTRRASWVSAWGLFVLPYKVLAQLLGKSRVTSRNSKHRMQRMQRGAFHHLPSRPISGLLLSSEHSHSGLWLHVCCK
jgi:hypothetical protein